MQVGTGATSDRKQNIDYCQQMALGGKLDGLRRNRIWWNEKYYYYCTRSEIVHAIDSRKQPNDGKIAKIKKVTAAATTSAKAIITQLELHSFKAILTNTHTQPPTT